MGRSYSSDNSKWGSEERRKSDNDRQRKGQKSFDVELLRLWWEGHLYCSGALCPDLKQADSDNSLEISEAYFLIKEHHLLETMAVGLTYCPVSLFKWIQLLCKQVRRRRSIDFFLFLVLLLYLQQLNFLYVWQSTVFVFLFVSLFVFCIFTHTRLRV